MNGRQGSLSTNPAGVGVVPRAVQIEFEREEKKIQQFETTNKKFYKDVRHYIDKLDELIKSETKMINNIANLAQTSLGEAPSMNSSNMNKTPNMTSSSTSASSTSSNDGVASSSTATSSSSGLNTVDEFNKEFLSKLTRCRDELVEHAKSVEAFKTSSQQSVVEPMKNLNSIFPQVYQAIRRRETALRELLKQQEKLDKLQDRERTGPNLVRINELQLTVSQLKQQFQKEHLFLMEELPKLYASRIDYIKPCVTTLIGGQAKFYQEYSQFYEAILNESSSSNSASATATATSTANQEENNAKSANSSVNNQQQYMNIPSIDVATENEVESLNNEIQQCLKEIKSLSIVASD